MTASAVAIVGFLRFHERYRLVAFNFFRRCYPCRSEYVVKLPAHERGAQDVARSSSHSSTKARLAPNGNVGVMGVAIPVKKTLMRGVGAAGRPADGECRKKALQHTGQISSTNSTNCAAANRRCRVLSKIGLIQQLGQEENHGDRNPREDIGGASFS